MISTKHIRKEVGDVGGGGTRVDGKESTMMYTTATAKRMSLSKI